MIEFYTGTPGSGKSAHLMKDIQEYANKGRTVVANFPLCKRPLLAAKSFRFHYVDTFEITPRFLRDNARDFSTGREDSALLIIDEAQLLFNSRTWHDSDRAEWVAFFTQHRKLGYRVILVTQSIEMVDKQVRALAEYNVSHRKPGNFGIGGRMISLFFLNRAFVTVTTWPLGKVRLGSGMFILTPERAAMYDTSRLMDEAPHTP